MNKALFLDRDGVINEDSHYPYRPEHIHFRKGIFDLCHYAISKGYTLIVITNQAGVARGKFTEEDVQRLHDWMKEQFALQDISIAGFYYCPYHPDGVIERYRIDSPMRKPKPGMLLQAAREHDIDLTQSFMLGDKENDRIELPGLKSIIVRSEYTTEGYDVETLEDAARML